MLESWRKASRDLTASTLTLLLPSSHHVRKPQVSLLAVSGTLAVPAVSTILAEAPYNEQGYLGTASSQSTQQLTAAAEVTQARLSPVKLQNQEQMVKGSLLSKDRNPVEGPNLVWGWGVGQGRLP